MNNELIPLAEDLLKETIGHYNSGNRAEHVRCVYRMYDGRRCAVGRMMTDEGAMMAAEHLGSVYSLRGKLGEESFLSLFQEKWRPLLVDKDGMLFVTLVQSLHDDGRYWNADGLSGMGLYHVEHTICDTFGLSLTNVMGAATDR